MKLGISGALTRAFINSPLTPLLLLAALVAGAIALVRCRARKSRRSACRWSTSSSPANGYKADRRRRTGDARRSRTSSRASTASSMSIRRPGR